MKRIILSSVALAVMVGVSQLFTSWMDSHPPTPPALPPVAVEAPQAPSSPVASEVSAEAQPVVVEFSLASVGIADHSQVVYARPTNTVLATNVVGTVQ